MSETEDAQGEAKPKRSKLPLILGLVLALAGGGGGFFAVYSGLVLAPDPAGAGETPMPQPGPVPDIAYVALEPMVINMGRASGGRHLRFRAQIEVNRSQKEAVETLVPRIMDVLNTYLRAVDLDVLEERSSLMKLRTQMLRRIDVVVGPGRVRDLLIMEFVMS
ncbi:flagellar basal body protein FliL [Pseudooceanicola sp. 216_PA32_1]|uniref:Flagellar protein FliL n=1 Tax=Pseudooceanicola pacificus TaxID=2676438 RepID=A0A844VY34_9RHOB|nr:flagellar basal body-associated FliL family protein [Pseudooceanicola pacificus]MWB76616.1 flagellar basal body protein FliL [Pseudooceanicola pacificus]